MPIELVPNAGACMVSRSVLDRTGRIRSMTRDASTHPADNGWRITSDVDASAPGEPAGGWQIADFNTLCQIEPALVGIYDLPIGSDLELVDDGRTRIIDTRTGREVPEEHLYVPAHGRGPGIRRLEPEPTSPPPRPGDWADIKDDVLRYLAGARGLVAAASKDDDRVTGEPFCVPREWVTDGAFVWPIAVTYYAQKHDIAPPSELLERMRALGFVPPTVTPDAAHRALVALRGS